MPTQSQIAIRAALTALLTGTLLATTPALAQSAVNATANDSPDIIVTATKREESLQKVPISIQALSAARLEQHQVTSFDDYAKLLPSVSFQSFGPGQSQIYFRGVTSGGDGQHNGSQPTSALYLDEIPLTTIAGSVDLHVYDMQRVEALSGPQGTLYGSSSLAGTLRLITNKPSTKKLEAGFDVTGTTFGKGANSFGGSFDGFVNIPINQNIAFRASGFYERDGGFISNTSGSRTYTVQDQSNTLVPFTINNSKYAKKNFNDTETYGGRAALGIDLGESWTATPTVIYQNQKAHGTYLFDPKVGDLQVHDFTPDLNIDEWTQAALTIHGKLSNWDVTYAGGYFERRVDNTADYSYYTVAYYANNGPAYTSFLDKNGKNIDPTQVVHGHDKYTKQSHELRVSSPAENRFRLTAGMFYERQTDQIAADYIISGQPSGTSGLAATTQVIDTTKFLDTNKTVLNPTYGLYIPGNPAVAGCGDDIFCTRAYRVDRDYAAFADASFDLLPNLTVSGGIRLFIARNTLYGSSGLASSQAPGCKQVSNFALSCINFDKVADQSGQVHRVNVNWKIDRDHLIYATYSTGYRPGGSNRNGGTNNIPSTFAPDTLTNYEIGVKTQWLNRKLTLNAAIFDEEWKKVQFGLSVAGSNGVVSTYNTGNAQIKGVEGDFNLSLGNLNLSGSGTYLDAKLKSDFSSFDKNGNVSDSAPAGTLLPIQPKFKINGTARYKLNFGSVKGFVQGSANHQSGTRSYLTSNEANALGPTRGFTTFDFSLGANMGKWNWEAYVQNAFDKRGILSLNTACLPSICGRFARSYPTKPQEFGIKLGTKF